MDTVPCLPGVQYGVHPTVPAAAPPLPLPAGDLSRTKRILTMHDPSDRFNRAARSAAVLPLIVMIVSASHAVRAQPADANAGAHPDLRASYRLAKPRGVVPLPTYTRADTVHFRCAVGVPSDQVAACVIEIRRNARTMTVKVGSAAEQAVALPHDASWDANTETSFTDTAPYIAQLVVRTRDGREQRSNALSIPVRLADSKFERRERTAGKQISRFSLNLFAFDRADLTELNRRILSEYVYPDIGKDAEVEVIGHMDIVGLAEHNAWLSERRAAVVAGAIRENVAFDQCRSLEERGVGSGGPIYTNDLPEGRFFNRTTQVIVYNQR